MSLLKHISNFLIEKVLPIKFKVWLLDRLACDIASQGEDGDRKVVKEGHDNYLYIKVDGRWMKTQLEEAR